MATRFSNVNWNTNEELLSADLARVGQLVSRDAQDVLKYEGRGYDAFDFSAQGTIKSGGDSLPTLVPVGGTRTFTLGAGQAYLQDGAITGDNSTFQVVRWPQQTVSYVAAEANPRYDLIVATPAQVTTDAANRNVLVDAISRLVNVVNVNKTTNPLATISVTKGTAGASPVPPAVPAGAIALFEVYVPSAGGGGNDSLNTAYARRLWRRMGYPWSGSWGVVSGCGVLWSDVDETAAGSSVMTLSSSEVHRVLINGELLEWTGAIEFIDAPGADAPAAGGATFDRTYYLYLVGGSSLPQMYGPTTAGARPPVLGVRSSRAPDTTFPGRPIGAVSTARGTTQNGAVFVGIGAKVRNTSNDKPCTMAGDWVYGMNFPFIFNTAATAIGPGPGTGTFTASGAPVDAASQATLLRVSYTDTAAAANRLFLSQAATYAEFYRVNVPASATSVDSVAWPRTLAGAITVYYSGSNSANLFIDGAGYQLKIPRISP